MTADELTELACLKFQTPLFMQSFCHTAAYPKEADVKTHKKLPQYVIERNGLSLMPGDGVIHTWLNRMLIPDTVGTGGDSHTRFPLGISFPAGSGLVAFAGALGFMPLDMPESVLVKFKGKLKSGITLRDVVNAIPYFAIQEGLMTVPKKNKINIFNGRILEMEGLPDITVEQAFELTDAAAEGKKINTTTPVGDFLKAIGIGDIVADIKNAANAEKSAMDTYLKMVKDLKIDGLDIQIPEIPEIPVPALDKYITALFKNAALEKLNKPDFDYEGQVDNINKLKEGGFSKLTEDGDWVSVANSLTTLLSDIPALLSSLLGINIKCTTDKNGKVNTTITMNGDVTLIHLGKKIDVQVGDTYSIKMGTKLDVALGSKVEFYTGGGIMNQYPLVGV